MFQIPEVEMTFDKNAAKYYAGYFTHITSFKSHKNHFLKLFSYFTHK